MPKSISASAPRPCTSSSSIVASFWLALVFGLAAALGLLNPSSATAQTQTYPCETVMQFGTGMSTNGAKLRSGSVDPSFQGTDATFPNPPNAYVLTDPPAAWIANSASADSQWIGPSSSVADDVAGTSVYRLLIVSPCAGATLTGRYAASDRGVIRLNGQPISFPTPVAGSTTWTAFSFNNLLSGINRLEFYITNSIPAVGGPPGPTGLRAELTVTATCCPCIELACPRDQFLTTCSNGAPANFSITGTNRCFTNLTINCSLASIAGVPVTSGFVFPVGTNTVICNASDTAGHRTNCTFRVVVARDSEPPQIRCPRDIAYLCGGRGTNVFFNPTATDDVDPNPVVACVPPSGSFFLPGTNSVTCTARDACGNLSRCSFNVLLAPDGFTKTILAGVADNFSPAGFEAPLPGPCLGASGFWTGMPFDTYFPGRHFSHSFQGLPNDLSAAKLILHMKPRLTTSQDDMLRIGLQNCGGAGVWTFTQPVASLPGAGGTWVTNPPTTFTLDLGALPGGVNLLAAINANHRLEFAVGAETLVDYARLEVSYCGPQSTFSGVPYSLNNVQSTHREEGVSWRTVNSNGPPPTIAIDVAGADGFRLNYPSVVDARRSCETVKPMTVVWPKPGGLTVTARILDIPVPGRPFEAVWIEQPGNLIGKKVEVWNGDQLVSRHFFAGPNSTEADVPGDACVVSQGFAKDYYFVNFSSPQLIVLPFAGPATHVSGEVGPQVMGTSVRLYFRPSIALTGLGVAGQPLITLAANTLSIGSISLLHGNTWIEAFGPQQLTISDAIHSLGVGPALQLETCVGGVYTLNPQWTVELNGTADFCTATSLGGLVCKDGYLDVKIKLDSMSPGGAVLRLTPTALPFDDCHMECFAGGPPNSLTVHRMVGGPVTLNNVSAADFSNWPLALHGELWLQDFDVTLPANTVVTVGAQTYNANGVTFHRTQQIFLDGFSVCLQTTFLPGISSSPPELSFKSFQTFGGPSIAPDCLTFTCPTNVIVNCTNAAGTVVTFNPTGETRCGSNVVITCDPPSGSVFPPGASVVQCSAIDSQGNQDQCRFLVTVLPPPSLTVTRLDGNRVELRWVGDAIVESAEVLGDRPVWRQVNGTPTSSGAESILVVPIDRAQQFFRTRQ